MSNTQGQNRYHEEMKALAASATSQRDESLRDLLIGQYLAAGTHILAHHARGADWAECLEEFLNRPPLAVLDMISIMRDAGEKAALVLCHV